MYDKKPESAVFVPCVGCRDPGAGGTTVSGYMQASKYKMNLNYNYQRAVTDLGDCVDNIENTLNKSI